MSLHDRAAQFAPFAALTGYDDAVKEASRLTDSKPELDENQFAKLNLKLEEFSERISEQPVVCIAYYEPDERKDGGVYVTFTGRLRKIDKYNMQLVFANGKVIKISDITEIR